MDSYSFNDPIIYARRSGKSNDPFVSITESLVLDNSARVTLTEIPSEWHGLIVEGENQEWFEIKKGIPSSNQYIVDYPNRQVTFAQDHIGKQFSFSFMGTGNTFTSASSIYTERNGLEVTETLKTLTDSTSAARNEVIQTNNLVKANENERKQSEDTRKQNEQNRQAEHISMVNNTGYIEPYNANTTYKKNNIVTFNGASFMAKKQTKGNQPPNILVSEDNEFWGLLTRKGADGTGTVHVHRDVFTATEGQTAFTLTYTYDQFQNRTSVTVGGVPQRTPENYEETTSNTITLSEGVPAGTIIEVKYFSEAVPLQSDIQTTVDNHTSVISSYASRLNNHDNDISTLNTQMAQKLTQGNVSVNDINKNLGKFDQTYMSDEFLQQMAGATPINATPAPLSVTSVKLAHGSVTPEKVDFIKISSNLIDHSKVLKGKSISSSDGSVTDSVGNAVSDFIAVTPQVTYSHNLLNLVAFYDENKNYLSYVVPTNPFTTVANCYFIRVRCLLNNANTMQLNKGNTLLEFEPFFKKMTDDIDVTPGISTVSTLSIIDKSVTPEKTDFLNPSSNLFNKKTVTEGKYIDSSGGIGDNTGYAISEFIPVKPQTEYSSAVTHYIACYDLNRNFITRITGQATGTTSFTTPSNCHYIRLSLNTLSTAVNIDEVQVNEGNVLLDYEEYGFTFSPSIKGLSTERDFEKEDRYSITGVLDKYYSQSNSLPPYPGGVHPDVIYAYYDNIMANHPDYVTKTQIGLSVNGVPIYRYDFKQPEIDAPETKFPKMLLISGMHGGEKMAVEVLKHSMAEIADNWSTNEVLETLRWNVHIVVIPIANPDGFITHQRWNVNTVDINRNFPAGWTYYLPDSGTYSGEEPLTEPETVALKNVVDSEEWIYVCDFHNYSSRTQESNKHELLWLAGANLFHVNLFKAFLRKVSVEWKKKNNSLPQDESTIFGYASMVPGGTVAAYAASLYIQSGTYECAPSLGLYDETDGTYGPIIMKMQVEAYINWLIFNLRNNI